MEFEKEEKKQQNTENNEIKEIKEIQENTSEENSVQNIEDENKQLKEKVAELEAQLKEIQNAARFIKASFENYKLDVERQLKENTRSTALRIFRNLIPIVDDFKRALNYYNQTQDLEEFYKGTQKIIEKFFKTLENEGLKPIDTSGRFDPFLHEAVEREEREDVEEYTIIETIEEGYTYNGQVIKPAKVKVAIKPRKS
ncbi:nucleotide exchange factor GrpE [Fervidobacterium sp. 2310opik-2]|uniref:nucleotide exchange factor GrpE n=1 Tax=Fervidobacterium sp. 2310opik-2 TaxID=1755815 RepID=UPI0013E08FD6|nr:nucleotide exchange factor GrpE [Fervidobacterium sp. 2310opik-2]KAF2962385.1 molecular chaperone GrpE [Fervidobacterium sp. 2310opik-2]